MHGQGCPIICETIMNLKTLREILYRLDHQHNPRNKLSSMAVMDDVGWYEGNVVFQLQITLNDCTEIFNFPRTYHGFDEVSLWNNYSKLSEKYVDHAWLSLMEFIDYKINCLVEQNQDEDEELTDF